MKINSTTVLLILLLYFYTRLQLTALFKIRVLFVGPCFHIAGGFFWSHCIPALY
jgi:hypothetical protein